MGNPAKIIITTVALYMSPLMAMERVDEKDLAFSGKDGVCFFESESYAGDRACYQLADNEEEAWSNLPSSVKNEVTSIRLYGKAETKVYKGSNLDDYSSRVMANVWKMDHLNDDLNSFLLRRRSSDHFACFYEHPGYRGTARCTPAGTDESSYGGLRNRFSSVILAGNAQAEVFDGTGFSRGSRIIDRSYHDLDDIGWDDDINSAKVRDGGLTDWEQAVAFQYSIGREVSIYQQHQISSHNTYNSSAYLSGLFLGKNHSYSIYEQLEKGVREFEMDAHGSNSTAYFCHSVDCGTSRVNSRRALSEIKTYLDTHPNEFLIIRLEDAMNDGEYDWMREALERTFGDELYSPRDIFPKSGYSCEDTGEGARVPVDVSVADLQSSGKRILIWGLSCDNSGASKLDELVWKRSASEPDHDYDFAGRCDKQSDTKFVRVVESDNNFDDKTVPSDQISSAVKCGVNGIAMDHIDGGFYKTQTNELNAEISWDGRFGLQMWFWKPGQSELASSGQCALSAPAGNEGIEDNSLASLEAENCSAINTYLCKTGDDWVVSQSTGTWGNGESLCAEMGADFAVPRTPVEALEMLNAIRDSGHSEVWVNFKGDS